MCHPSCFLELVMLTIMTYLGCRVKGWKLLQIVYWYKTRLKRVKAIALKYISFTAEVIDTHCVQLI